MLPYRRLSVPDNVDVSSTSKVPPIIETFDAKVPDSLSFSDPADNPIPPESVLFAAIETGVILYIERLVTYAKRGDVHGRRLIQKRIAGKRGKEIANILIHDIAPAYADRHGGYTRLIKLNNRKNDNAPVSLIEFIDLAPNIIESKDSEALEGKKGETKE